MNEAMSDATPVTQKFLASLSQFLEHQHGGPGKGDISQEVKQALETAASETKPSSPSGLTPSDGQE